MLKTLIYALALSCAGLVPAVHGEVVEALPTGFEVKQQATIAAPPEKVWAALGQIGQWWDSQHSWSGDATNLSLDLKPGGCLCEKLPNGGGAWHLTVVFVAPPKTVRLEGALGPLVFTGGSGHLIWTLAPKDGGTVVTQTYDFGGYMKGGLDKIAGPVDGVLGEQLGRLKAFVETGKPA
ncbi:MAG: SRPBCC domain-containing protein [Caulobacterales bacterium]